MIFNLITLTYNSDSLQDGTGGQVLRIVGIRSLAAKLRLGYIHTPIKYIMPNHMDHFQTDSEIANYVEEVNEIFHFYSNTTADFSETVEVFLLTRKLLLKYLIRALVLRKKILLKVTSPFQTLDFISDSYKLGLDNLSIPFRPELDADNTTKIVVHLRRGVKPDHVDKWEKKPTQLDLQYVSNIIDKILNQAMLISNFKISIVTDSPERSFVYNINSKDLASWKEHFGDFVVNGSIKISSFEKYDTPLKKYTNLTFFRGGNPIDALKIMAGADYLILSKQNFSYLGGVLNQKGTVFYPPYLRRAPMSHWISGVDFVTKSNAAI